MKKNPHAVALGKLGGKVSSEAKRIAAQANAKLPRKRALKHENIIHALDSIGFLGR